MNAATIYPLLSQRHSPYVFDPARPVAESDLTALFEAARWAMSSYNEQPWRYIVGVKESNPTLWEKIHGLLVEGNQPWAAYAPVLALGIVSKHFARNGKANPCARHDLGAASAMLTVEATARGLCVHQMSGVETELAHSAFALPEDQEVVTGLAIGYPGQDTGLDAAFVEREQAPRTRKPLEEVALFRVD